MCRVGSYTHDLSEDIKGDDDCWKANQEGGDEDGQGEFGHP